MTKSSHFLIFIGIAFLIFSVLVTTSLNNEVLNMNSSYGENKLGVKVKSKCSGAFFSRNDIYDLGKYLKTEEIACSSVFDSNVLYNEKLFSVKIVGVNYRYSDFYSISIKYGSFFTSAGEREGNCSVVIGSDLALDIFNTDKVIGKKIRLLDREYVIVGVYEPHGERDSNGAANKNIIEKLSEDGVPLIYVPVDKLLEYGAVKGIDALQIHTGNSKTLWKDDDEIETALRSIGKNTGYYKITNYKKNKALLWQLPQIMVFVSGCIIIACLFGFIKRKLTVYSKCIKNELKHSYLGDLIKRNALRGLIVIFPLIIVSALGLAVWQIIKFELYIPPEYIAEELIDSQYYSDLFKNKVISHNSELGFIPDISERNMDIVLKIGVFLAAAGLFAGIPMICAGFRKLKHLKESLVKTSISCSVWMSVSLMLVFLFCRCLGLNLFIDIKFMIIICIFLLCLVWDINCEPLNKKSERKYSV